MRNVTLSCLILNIFIKQFQDNRKWLSFYFRQIALNELPNVMATRILQVHVFQGTASFSNELKITFEEKYTLYPETGLIWKRRDYRSKSST